MFLVHGLDADAVPDDLYDGIRGGQYGHQNIPHGYVAEDDQVLDRVRCSMRNVLYRSKVGLQRVHAACTSTLPYSGVATFRVASSHTYA
jgi:hypothetical protein